MIKDTADKLLLDGASRGDVKLLATAIRELRYAFHVYNRYRGRRKVTIFGSARTKPEEPIFQQAIEFGRLCAAADYMVITGAASGIMEAGHIGAGREKSFGLNIMLPFEQGANSIIDGDPKLIHMRYFFTRKLMFVKESDAVVLMPGGFGTHDEGFETLTLVQTGKSHLIPIILLDEPGGDYWKKFLDFVEGVLLPRRLISPEDRSFYRLTDNAAEALREITTFYRVYHSMRYVKGELIIRLNCPVSEDLPSRLTKEFRDIIVGDEGFKLVGAHPLEANETHLADLPRLSFRFNRRSHGRLRQVIDIINQCGC